MRFIALLQMPTNRTVDAKATKSMMELANRLTRQAGKPAPQITKSFWEGVQGKTFLQKRFPLHAPSAPSYLFPDTKKTLLMLLVIALLMLWLIADAHAWTGRRAVLYAEAEVMLALNEPWVLGRSDCSSQMWRLLRRTFPELTVVKWFRRTTAEAMATWPWEALLTLDRLFFGDLIFANSEEYDRTGADGRRVRPDSADFKINHVLMAWTDPEEAIHAGKKRGFSRTKLRPYWQPRIVLAVRPPY